MCSVSRIFLSGILLFEFGLIQPAMAVQAPATLFPAGFENLATIGESEKIDVRIGGKSLGLFDAHVTTNHLLFSHPERILIALPLKKSVDKSIRTMLLQRLKKPMALNGELACDVRESDAESCGYINSKNIDIIYDEENAEADVFIRNSLLAPTSEAHSQWFRPSVNTSRAFIQQTSLAFSGSSGYRSASLDAHAALGVSASSFLASDYTFSYNSDAWGQQTELDFSNIYYRYDMGRSLYLQIGRMDARDLSTPMGGTFAFSMLPLDRVDGFRIGTTQAYINSEAQSRRTPVTVLLSQNARVDAYRGAQLLSSSYFRPGIHELDTSAFPPGTYLLTLRIVENGHEVRSESRPFSRIDGGLDSPGGFQWFAEAGKSSLSNYADNEAGRAVLGGIKLSLSSNTSVTFGVEDKNEVIYSEGRMDWQHPFSAGLLDISASIFGGSNGARGNAESISWSGPYSASLSWEDSRSSDCSASQASSCDTYLTASLSHSFFGWQVRAGLAHSSSEWVYGYLAPDSNEIIDPNENWLRPQYFSAGSMHQVWVHRRSQSSSLQLSASHAFVWRNMDVDADASLYVRRVDHHNDRGVYLELQLHHAAEVGSAGDKTSIDSALTYNLESTADGSQSRVGMSADITRQDALHESANGSLYADQSGNIDVNMHGRIAGQDGNANAGISEHYDARRGASVPAFSGAYAGTIGISSAGVFIGSDTGDDRPNAAVVVSTKGGDPHSPETVASVRGDGQPEEGLRSGRSVFLPQTAYRPIDVDIEDPDAEHGEGVASVKDGLGKQTWFMLPGHIGHQAATVQFTYTYVGKLTTDKKRSLSDAIILGGDFVQLNDDGTFAADFHHQPKVLNVLSGKSLFQCSLPSMVSTQSLFNIHTVRCLPVDPSALPSDVRNNALVIKLLTDHHVRIMRDVAITKQGAAPLISQPSA
ncbi:TcfC E-set like domain-containing protein [Robbsia andropogonis]|uniref:TcfC E-set like domain-containing protein n=1 Tax=Robbsia andropogonis TaxID=28092 RepID=UPI003D235BCC